MYNEVDVFHRLHLTNLTLLLFSIITFRDYTPKATSSYCGSDYGASYGLRSDRIQTKRGSAGAQRLMGELMLNVSLLTQPQLHKALV